MKNFLDNNIRNRYESLHKDLLYSSEKQDFDRAIDTFEKISEIFKSIGE